MWESDAVKPSRKSKMKKRPADWEQLKREIAQELGLWPQVESQGWSALSAADSGRLGGVFAARKRALQQAAADADEAADNTAATDRPPGQLF